MTSSEYTSSSIDVLSFTYKTLGLGIDFRLEIRKETFQIFVAGAQVRPLVIKPRCLIILLSWKFLHAYLFGPSGSSDQVAEASAL